MKTYRHQIFVLLLLIFVLSCNQSSQMEKAANVQSAPASAESDAMVGNEATPPLSSSAAVERGKDSLRKFIRTADLKFKVKNVVHTTYSIEDIVTRMNGFVSLTTLNSEIGTKTTTAVSADSSLVTTWYSVSNSMVIRVPNTALDSTLKSIAPLVAFLDYRIVKADDVALKLLSNQLAQKRAAKHEERLTTAIDKHGKKLIETTNVEELLLSQQEKSDEAKISNLSLMDQVQYSTININMYQEPTAIRELIYNDQNIEAYKPGLGTRLAEALKAGWIMITALLVFVAGLWGFILLAVILYLLYRKFGHLLKGK